MTPFARAAVLVGVFATTSTPVDMRQPGEITVESVDGSRVRVRVSLAATGAVRMRGTSISVVPGDTTGSIVTTPARIQMPQAGDFTVRFEPLDSTVVLRVTAEGGAEYRFAFAEGRGPVVVVCRTEAVSGIRTSGRALPFSRALCSP